jgi:hypothetical protein
MDDGYSVHNNTIKWSGFFKTEDEAQKDLEKKAAKVSLRKRIVSSKKELQEKRGANTLLYNLNDLHHRVAKDMLLYKFTIVTAPLEEKLD